MKNNTFSNISFMTLLKNRIGTVTFWFLGVTVILFITLTLYLILSKGLPYLTPEFLIKEPDEIEEGGGIGTVLFNSFYVLILSMLIATPIGIGSGVYLAEYAPKTRFIEFIRTCVEALASVPSIVIGLFGLVVFVVTMELELTILSASLSLAILNLPVLTRVTEESINAVPQKLRDASYALGTTKFQTILFVVIPAAMNGIITGISLVAGRAYGESAVIILAGGVTTSGIMWDFNLNSPGGTLAVHLWYVQSEAIVPDAQEIASKSAAVLVFVVLLINLLLRIPIWINNYKLKR